MKSREKIMDELVEGCASIAAYLIQSFLYTEKASVDEINNMYIAALGEQI